MNELELKEYILKLNKEYSDIQEALKRLQTNLEYVIEQIGIEAYCKNVNDIIEENEKTVYRIDNDNFYLDSLYINGKECLVFKPCKIVKYESSN